MNVGYSNDRMVFYSGNGYLKWKLWYDKSTNNAKVYWILEGILPNFILDECKIRDSAYA